ncbi:MAG TPA: hypothetical protein P5084_02465 [Paludibacter sp.]|nr:hypothetical protein [Paludibacter sp.]
MKFLAIEKDIPNTNRGNIEKILADEARKVYELYLSGALREIYFNEAHNAVLILECESKNQAFQLLDSLPLIKSKMIEFEVMELLPYTGFQRIMN